MRIKIILSIVVLFSLLTSCNMPTGQASATQPPENKPASLDADAMATAVELTAIARVTQIAGSAVPATPTFTETPTSTPTSAPTSVPATTGPCSPSVTANVVANVRSGPDTAYDVVGSLAQGQTATIVGRNDAYTWWYIDYAGIAGGHAWVSGTVVTSACVPAVVQVVAAPPLPTAIVADNSSSGDSSNDSSGDSNDDGGNNVVVVPNLKIPLLLLKPDLVITGMSVNPSPAKKGNAITVKITVKNQGTLASGNFSVQWWSSWAVVGKSLSVSSLDAGASKTLSFSYTYNGCSNYDIKAVADEGGLVKESKEDNNSLADTLLVKCN